MTVAKSDDDPLPGESMSNCEQDAHEDIEQKSVTTEATPPAAEQKTIINEAIKKQLVIGETWYLVDIHWYKQWKKYVDSSTKIDEHEHPGPIDNSPLFDSVTMKLKEHLLEGSDYKLISQSGWELLVQWYHLAPKQEPIARRVIEHGCYVKDLKVEVYLIELKLSTFRNVDKIEIQEFSKVNTIVDVVNKAKDIFGIPPSEEIRIWNQFMQKTYELISKLESTLQDLGMGSGQMLILEQKNDNNEWPRQGRTRTLSSSGMNPPSSPMSSSGAVELLSTCSPVTSTTMFGSRQRSMSMRLGLCGLTNIGNTCFMNAALQCLSNTLPLTKYFLSGTYEHDINPSNPLGMHGKIAEAYADLIRNMWNGKNTSFTPRQFKIQVGRFAPQFSGYQQQDTHELLAFLLDGLHEDLNRVKQKPYIELQDDKGRPDSVVAAETWRNHSLRNNSIIVDYFHGQFKSTVECPVCNKHSVTFDPFCYLSLPLPIKKERNLIITFVSLDTSKKPLKLKITVPKGGNTMDLTAAVANLTGVDQNKLVVAEVFGSKFQKRFAIRDNLNSITERDNIVVYEIPIDASNAEHEELLILPVYMREIKLQQSHYVPAYAYSSNSLFGTPLLVTVPKTSTTVADLYKLILRAMRRFVRTPTAEDVLEDKALNTEDDESMEELGDEIKLKEDSQEQEKETVSSETDDEKKVKQDKLTDPVTLFEIKIVNSAGTQDIKALSYDDNEALNLTSKVHLAIDWHPKLKKKHYDENLATDCEEHESIQTSPTVRKNIHLYDCLDLFLQREQLGEEDPWFCPDCKEHRQAYKKFDLWTLPKVLVIHLKRFSYNRYWRDKIDALVDFPVTQMDLSKYVRNEKHPRAVYDLHAVANHYGGLGGGHYTAYGVNCYDRQWYYFDDSSVSGADASSPVSKAAYVLFYNRRDDPDNEMMNVSELTDVFQKNEDGDDDVMD